MNIAGKSYYEMSKDSFKTSTILKNLKCNCKKITFINSQAVKGKIKSIILIKRGMKKVIHLTKRQKPIGNTTSIEVVVTTM